MIIKAANNRSNKMGIDLSTCKLKREEKAKAKRYAVMRLLDKSTKVSTALLFLSSRATE